MDARKPAIMRNEPENTPADHDANVADHATKSTLRGDPAALHALKDDTAYLEAIAATKTPPKCAYCGCDRYFSRIARDYWACGSKVGAQDDHERSTRCRLAERDGLRAERDKLRGFYTEIVNELGHDRALQEIAMLRQEVIRLHAGIEESLALLSKANPKPARFSFRRWLRSL